MGYCLYLVDENGVEARLPVRFMAGGAIYSADYDPANGVFNPRYTDDTCLSITYNYGRYYHEATEGDERFAHQEVSAYYADGTQGPIVTRYGLAGIDGKTGREAAKMLYDVVNRIQSKYMENGKWLFEEGHNPDYWVATAANAVDALERVIEYSLMLPDCIWRVC